MKSLKGQGLPLNIIIIAIILVVCVIVVIIFFTGRFGGFGKDVDSCFTRGGVCRADNCGPGEQSMQGSCASDEKCCVSVGAKCADQPGEPTDTKCAKPEDQINGIFSDVKQNQVCCKK